MIFILLAVLWSLCDSFQPHDQRFTFLSSKNKRITLCAAHSPSGPPTPASGYSFVEGSDFFDSELEEIVAMGGDPFFLDDEQHTEHGAESNVETSGEDGNVEFQWSGEVDDEVYFD